MRKYSTKGTNKLLISFVIKSIVTTIVTVLCFTFLSSEIVYKLDVDLNKSSIISIAIVVLSSLIISLCSVHSMNNSGVIFGVLSQIPLMFYMLINAVFNESGWLIFLIKICISVLVSAIAGIISCEKSKKIKVR